jgi:hypothetical protein
VRTWQGIANGLPVTFFIEHEDDDNTFVAVARVDDQEFNVFGYQERPTEEIVEKRFIEEGEAFRKAVGLKKERIITLENHDKFI